MSKCKTILKYISINNLGQLSPNEVNLLAWNIGIIDLTSQEVIYISDNS
jgi:hypothetical protein